MPTTGILDARWCAWFRQAQTERIPTWRGTRFACWTRDAEDRAIHAHVTVDDVLIEAAQPGGPAAAALAYELEACEEMLWDELLNRAVAEVFLR